MARISTSDVAGAGALPDKLSIHGLLVLVVFALGYEFVALPFDLSVFKLVVAPLSMVGAVWLLARGVPERSLPGVLVLFAFPVLMLLTAARWQEMQPVATALGLLPFLFFLYAYVVIHGWGPWETTAVATYSLPHLVSLILFRLGLSNAAYTKSPLRFDGIHDDPNLMVIFILAAASAKFVLIDNVRGRRTRWALIALLVLDYWMVILSGSRGGAVGALIVLLVWLGLRWGVLRMLVRVVPVAALALGAALTLLPHGGERTMTPGLSHLLARFEETSSATDNSSDIRAYLLRQAVDEIRESGLWVGASTQRFVRIYGHYPHNTILDAALETGVPGAVLLLALMVGSLGVLVSRRRRLGAYGVHVLYLGVSFWSTLMFLSSFSAKAFWLSVTLPLAMSVRLLTGEPKGGSE